MVHPAGENLNPTLRGGKKAIFNSVLPRAKASGLEQHTERSAMAMLACCRCS